MGGDPEQSVVDIGLASWVLGKNICGWGRNVQRGGCCTVGPRVGILIMEEVAHWLYAWGALETAGERCHWEGVQNGYLFI